MKKFTFKTEKPTGRYSSFYKNDYHIKMNNQKCGNIYSDNNGWYVSLLVYEKDLNEDGNPNCEFMPIKFNKRLPSLEECKSWLNSEEVRKHIEENYKLYLLSD
jgi:hypothetical protein